MIGTSYAPQRCDSHAEICRDHHDMSSSIQNGGRKATGSASPLSSLALIIFLTFLLWRSVGVLAGDILWSRSPSVALFFDPSLARAREVYALSKLTVDYADPASAEAEFKTALQRDPLAPSIVKSLAKFYEAQRQNDRALALWPIAASSAWRDGEAQLQALQIALRAQDYKKSLQHIDAVMRSFPSGGSKIAAQVAAYLDVPQFRDAFITTLSLDPPWRPNFLSTLDQAPVSMAAVSHIYNSLKSAATPLSNDELRPYLRRLVANGFYENAYLVWIASLPEAAKPSGELLYNGNFQFPISNMPFDWTIDPVPGVDVSVEKKAFERRLKIVFSHTRSSFRNIRQVLFLSAGDYVFSGIESSDMISNERGVLWRIRCINTPDSTLAISSKLTDTIIQRPFTVSFAVPKSCPVQEIRLEVPARSEAERAINGKVEYSALFLKRVDIPMVNEP